MWWIYLFELVIAFASVPALVVYAVQCNGKIILFPFLSTMSCVSVSTFAAPIVSRYF